MNQPALKPWPADKVTAEVCCRAEAHARNARLHSDAQVGADRCVDRRVGLDDAGPPRRGRWHHRRPYRVLAARKLGIDAVPCMVASGLERDAQKRAYVIADNQIADNAIWSEDLLRIEFEGLEALKFDLGPHRLFGR